MKEMNHLNDDLSTLRDEIAELRADITRYMNEEGRRNYTAFEAFRLSCADIIIAGEFMQATNCLDEAAADCPMKKNCIPLFSKNLLVILNYLRESDISAERVAQIKKDHEEVFDQCKHERCSSCITESRKLFAEQVKLLKNAGVYTERESEVQIHELQEQEVVAWLGEPLSNITRIKILKSLASEPKSFADLSSLTSLRGGNLLFHLEKLMNSGMILQKGERKDYMITARGYELLRSASEFMEKLG